MISYLKGKLTAKHPPTLLIENNGLGYMLYASMQTFYQLPEIDQEICLHTLLLVREDIPWLYGFVHTNERKLFQELLKVNTIGPKAALAILSNLNVEYLYQVIINQDIRTLQNIPGIGKKTAERLLLELSNRLSHWEPTLPIKQANLTHEKSEETSHYAIKHDAIEALMALGYKSMIATNAVNRIATDSHYTSEELIRAALTQLNKS